MRRAYKIWLKSLLGFISIVVLLISAGCVQPSINILSTEVKGLGILIRGDTNTTADITYEDDGGEVKKAENLSGKFLISVHQSIEDRQVKITSTIGKKSEETVVDVKKVGYIGSYEEIQEDYNFALDAAELGAENKWPETVEDGIHDFNNKNGIKVIGNISQGMLTSVMIQNADYTIDAMNEKEINEFTTDFMAISAVLEAEDKVYDTFDRYFENPKTESGKVESGGYAYEFIDTPTSVYAIVTKSEY
ncbi:hypothetical protein BMT55_14520 [Listeria newyorkensis]|uniref:Lipoprotein n=1 Tax=Listeria newyorkensis TaxID=1497681 RepID=A0ABX4XKD1_9LIST|nr:hypothetical protein [Listeria newyorkensis]KGL43265.1 hypothetical protein EP58_08205 [Listeria newyorkensis]PNP88534.1 hypothetical protein BMT55_14520 [Listeria newyorkensis]WAO22406.1 hypothetical protein OTR81_03790 [Listeria newyorkensis]SQC50685.1 Uncharacterised protein [Listeria newyorkensis]